MKPKDVVMPFGKHKGKTLGWIAANDLLYLDWLVDIEYDDKRLQAAVEAIHNEHGAEIEEMLEG